MNVEVTPTTDESDEVTGAVECEAGAAVGAGKFAYFSRRGGD